MLFLRTGNGEHDFRVATTQEDLISMLRRCEHEYAAPATSMGKQIEEPYGKKQIYNNKNINAEDRYNDYVADKDIAEPSARNMRRMAYSHRHCLNRNYLNHNCLK